MNLRGDCDRISHLVWYWFGDTDLGCPPRSCGDCRDLLCCSLSDCAPLCSVYIRFPRNDTDTHCILMSVSVIKRVDTLSGSGTLLPGCKCVLNKGNDTWFLERSPLPLFLLLFCLFAIYVFQPYEHLGIIIELTFEPTTFLSLFVFCLYWICFDLLFYLFDWTAWHGKTGMDQ